MEINETDMKENQDKDDKLSQAIDAMESGACFHESDKVHLNDAEVEEACKDIAYIEKVLLEKHCPSPDVEGELEKVLSSRKKDVRPLARKRMGIFVMVGIAAMLALVFIFRSGDAGSEKASLTDVIMAEAEDSPTEISLQIGKSASVPLSMLTDETLRKNGATLDDDGKGMTYAPITGSEVVYCTISVPRQKDFKLVLADGTEVWLNAESTLTYPNRFAGNNRVVRLHGEAYFKVSQDKEHPFVVETDFLCTEVLGTEFNVRTYKINDCHVTLIKGRVRVEDINRGQMVELQPGQDVGLAENKGFVLESVNTEVYTAWKDGLFYFDNVTLEDIMDELSRWYGVEIVYTSSVNKNISLRFLANRRGSLEEVLALLNTLGRVEANYEPVRKLVTIK